VTPRRRDWGNDAEEYARTVTIISGVGVGPLCFF